MPRQLVRRIALRHGWQATHPVAMAVVGAILIFVAIGIPSYYFFREARTGSLLVLSPALFLVVAIFGMGLVYKALSRGYFIELILEEGSQRLGFRNRPKIEDIEKFLKSVEEKFGYVIERSGATSGFEVIKANSNKRHEEGGVSPPPSNENQ